MNTLTWEIVGLSARGSVIYSERVKMEVYIRRGTYGPTFRLYLPNHSIEGGTPEH